MIKKKIAGIFPFIINNKLITICILFTIFTIIDTIAVFVGIFPITEGIVLYLNLLGRLFFFIILVFAIYIFDRLKVKIKSNILRYIIVMLLSWATLMIYLVINSFIIELQSNVFFSVSKVYIVMYLIAGITKIFSNIKTY